MSGYRADVVSVIISLSLSVPLIHGCAKEKQEPGFFHDTISAEGQTYPTLVIPELGVSWLAENLDIPTEGTSFCFEEMPHYCFLYGRLYTLEGAKEGCARLGPGWQVPALEDWRALGEYFGGFFEPNVTDSHLWDAEKSFNRLTVGGDSGFNIKKGGGYGSEQQEYYGSSTAFFWTRSAEAGSYFSYIIFGRSWDVNIIGKGGFVRSNDRLSCRCIKYE